MSVAVILWDEEPVAAIRWNGNSDEPLGNPMSRRQPTWFVVGEYAASVEQAAREAAERSPNSLVAEYRELANDSERELRGRGVERGANRRCIRGEVYWVWFEPLGW
jgi:hypothetical protein